jgi:uncharacterized membrane protein
MIDSKVRSIAKTISWRLTGSGATFLVVWLLTGSLIVAGPIAFVQLILNTILYYIHERVWTNINWGRNSL